MWYDNNHVQEPGKQDESTPQTSRRHVVRRAIPQDDQQEEESVHSFYVLIQVLIKSNLNLNLILSS